MLFALVLILCGCAPQGSTEKEVTLHQRVVDSGVIRASYANYPPYCIKDPNSGKLSGIFVEVLNEVGERLELKVEWVEEVGWGAIFEGLNSNRHDVFGAGIWRNSSRGKVGDFSDPLFYNLIKVYGRSDESRFSGSFDEINSPDIRISMMDGAMENLIANADYPEAKAVSVTQLNQWSDVLLNITSGKADLTFAEPSAVNRFLDKNPGELKELFGGKPVRAFANTYAFKHGEPEFKAMLNAAIEEIINDGTAEKIIRKYENGPNEFFLESLFQSIFGE